MKRKTSVLEDKLIPRKQLQRNTLVSISQNSLILSHGYERILLNSVYTF